MPKEQLQRIVVDAIEELKGQDIRVLDVSHLTTITDTMVIASGTSSRQIKAMTDQVVEKARAHAIRPLGVEGEEYGEWVLVDLGDVVVHLMLPEVRDFYGLEKLWSVPAEATG